MRVAAEPGQRPLGSWIAPLTGLVALGVGLEPSTDVHRRVLAVLTYLRVND